MEQIRNVATSSMVSEYVAMSRATKMLMRVNVLKERLLRDLSKLVR